MSDDLVDRVVEFVARETGVPRDRISTATDIEDDLGCTGVDASEFMAAFSQNFDVDLQGFRFELHFGPEAPADLGIVILSPLFLLARIFGIRWPSRSSPEPVTVGHLAAVADSGHWFRPPGQLAAALHPPRR
jgi:hypothetical protein